MPKSSFISIWEWAPLGVSPVFLDRRRRRRSRRERWDLLPPGSSFTDRVVSAPSPRDLRERLLLREFRRRFPFRPLPELSVGLGPDGLSSAIFFLTSHTHSIGARVVPQTKLRLNPYGILPNWRIFRTIICWERPNPYGIAYVSVSLPSTLNSRATAPLGQTASDCPQYRSMLESRPVPL